MRAREEVSVVPSTSIVKVPVGVVVLVLEPEATVMVIVSSAPLAGVLVAADNVVVEASNDEAGIVGHADSRLEKSSEPRPEASSYPVVAACSDSPTVEQ